jgi:hypothetical protein
VPLHTTFFIMIIFYHKIVEVSTDLLPNVRITGG